MSAYETQEATNLPAGALLSLTGAASHKGAMNAIYHVTLRDRDEREKPKRSKEAGLGRENLYYVSAPGRA